MEDTRILKIFRDYTWQGSGKPVSARSCAYNRPVNTTVTWYIKTPEFATRSEEKIEYFGACSGAHYDIVDIKIDGLELLKPASEDGLHGGATYYVLVGTTTPHPINHFGKLSTITMLKQIAWNYYIEFSTYPRFSKLAINDMSLRWGGLFDVYANWQPDHHEHRYGRQVDVRRINWSPSGQMIYMPKEQEKKLIEIACKFNVQVWQEGKDGKLTDPLVTKEWGDKSTAPHFHLRFPIVNDETENPPDVAPDLSECATFLEELKNEKMDK